MTKQYGRRTVAHWGQDFEFSAIRLNDGAFEFWQRDTTGFGKHRFDPTPGDWQSLALALTVAQDSQKQGDADMLVTLQDERDDKKALADALEYLADGADVPKCNRCGRYEAEGQSDDDGDWFCYPCISDNQHDACKCGRRDCGDCGRTASIGPY